MNHEIEIIEVGKSGDGLYLQYEIDGTQYDCTGEFYIDKNGVLHHTHIMPDGEEVEVTYQYFN